MSVADKKHSQGYTMRPKSCVTCAHFRFREAYETWGGRTYRNDKELRCGIGGFAVKKTATCNMWEDGE